MSDVNSMIEKDRNRYYEEQRKMGSSLVDVKDKQKAKVYTLKIGNLLLVFKRKVKKGETVVTHTRAQLLAADIYQANFFGYKPLGFKTCFVSAGYITKYLERKFHEQDADMKARFFKIMERQGNRRARLMKKVVSE